MNIWETAILHNQHGIPLTETYLIYLQAETNVKARKQYHNFQQYECDLVLEYARLKSKADREQR